MIVTLQRLLIKYKLFAYAFVVLYYVVGLWGLINPPSRPLFITLIPFSLILSFIFLFLFHFQPFNVKYGILFLTIFLVSFTVEAIGVASGFIFGSYSYGVGLGYKLFETPIIIGLNWVFVIYISASLGYLITKQKTQSVLISSLIMVVYDVVLERVAPRLDMWSWQDGVVPFQNYLAWFILALIFQTLLKISKIEVNNRMALLLLSCQILFFIILDIIL